MKTGIEIHQFIKKLFPITRSITGNGVRETLAEIKKLLPITITEVKTGTEVFDWTIPQEWNITDGYIKNSKGEKVVDFKKSNLHIVNYSISVQETMNLQELKKHIYTLADNPTAIPYRTSYYDKSWGFCMSDNQLQTLSEDTYEVSISSTLSDGSLTYAEYVKKGESDEEILISTHICHPSLANDNLSGIGVAVALAKYLEDKPTHFTYRFLFIPGTIGSLTWLSKNQKHIKKIKHAIVLTGLGDSGEKTYKKTRTGIHEIDQAFISVLSESNKPYTILDFYPYGYDERQYNSLGFSIPAGAFMRTQHGTYPEYHTSLDNLDFVKPESLADSLETLVAVLEVLEKNKVYKNLFPFGEPQLGKRGLFKAMNQVGMDSKQLQLAMLWILSSSDGSTSLLTIASSSKLSFSVIVRAAELLSEHFIIKEVIS